MKSIKFSYGLKIKNQHFILNPSYLFHNIILMIDSSNLIKKFFLLINLYFCYQYAYPKYFCIKNYYFSSLSLKEKFAPVRFLLEIIILSTCNVFSYYLFVLKVLKRNKNLILLNFSIDDLKKLVLLKRFIKI